MQTEVSLRFNRRFCLFQSVTQDIRRKKKCDKGRPFCQRCLDSKGKFSCLGYDDESEVEVERPRKAPPKTKHVTVSPLIRVGVEFGDTVVSTTAVSLGFALSCT